MTLPQLALVCMQGNVVERVLSWTLFFIKMRVLPETNERLNVDQLMQDECSFCHANVYLPSRGSTDDGMRFAECLDMLLEIVVKYRGSHIVVIGGDFNDSLHRGSRLRRDRIFAEFVAERRLNSDVTSPIRDTFFHVSNESGVILHCIDS